MLDSKIIMSEEDKLIEAAGKMRARSYPPYSGFSVGAALLTNTNDISSGCNIENRSLDLTICAERTAVAAAIAHGQREFVAVAVITDSNEPVLPCGACRQVLAEFNPSIKIIASTTRGRREIFSLADLLPRANQGISESFRDV